MTPKAPARNGWGSVATGGAAHEAAHGIVAVRYGIYPARLVLHTTMDGTEWRSGFNEFDYKQGGKLEANPLHDAVICAAGAEGHRQWLIKQGVSDAEATRAGVASGVGDTEMINQLVKHANGEFSESGVRSVAAAEVESLWEKIEAVANKLADKHRLGGWSVR